MKIGDCVEWIDKLKHKHRGIIAYIAQPGETLPDYLFKEGIRYKSRTASFGRYIIDCGEYKTNIDTTAVEYRAVSFNNNTLRKIDLRNIIT